MCKCRCNGEECSFSISSRAPTRFAFINGGQFRWRHLYLKISLHGGGGKNHKSLSPVLRYKQKNLLSLKEPSLPSPASDARASLSRSCIYTVTSMKTKNLNIFLITFLMGRGCLLIMQRSVVTVSDKGVRRESNRHFGDWRYASSGRRKVRVDTLWQKGEIHSDNKGK